MPPACELTVCGFRMLGTRRCATWFGHGSTPCTACAERASNSPDFCCARAAVRRTLASTICRIADPTQASSGPNPTLGTLWAGPFFDLC